MLFVEDVIKHINGPDYGGGGVAKRVRVHIRENNLQQQAAECIIETLASGVAGMLPVTAIASRIGKRLLRLVGFDVNVKHQERIRVGLNSMNWCVKAGIVGLKRVNTMTKNGFVDCYYVVSKSEEFTTFALNNTFSSEEIPLDQGPWIWSGPVLQFNQSDVLHIVLMPKPCGLSIKRDYAYDQMPEFYEAVNRLNRQAFRINTDLMNIAMAHPFAPRPISDDEKKDAMIELRKTKRIALYVHEIQFAEMNKWCEEHMSNVEPMAMRSIAERKAKVKSENYELKHSEKHHETISQWSKRQDFENVLKRAAYHKDSTLNFTWFADSRGRLYPSAPALNPIGSDFAKALLLWKDAKPVSAYDLAIHIANCFGEDKASYDDRVKWVNDHSDDIYDIGIGVANDLFEGLSKEKKTKWQGLAAAMEWVRYCDHINEGGSDEDFWTHLPIGLDATSSGVQIMTAIGRDDVVAPYVNLTDQDGVGDYYQYLGNFLSQDLHDSEESLDSDLRKVVQEYPVGHKFWRKVAKRNGMTFGYSATRHGMGDQHWEDRKDHGCPLYADLSVSSCRDVGYRMFSVCQKHIHGAATLMRFMRSCISASDKTGVVTWRLPDGFLAYQFKPQMKANGITFRFHGYKEKKFVFYEEQPERNKQQHLNAIAPNIIHSLDSALLRYMVRNMPQDANFTTVHDQFFTDSYYIPELQAVAKEAYKMISDRDLFGNICNQVAGKEMDLPDAGTWCPSELDKADYIIC